jgi:hypothetical protein
MIGMNEQAAAQLSGGGVLAGGIRPGPCQLPDGGVVEVTDATIVPLGEVRAFREITYTHSGGNDLPACRIVFDIRDGVSGCASFSLTRTDRNAILVKDLRAFKLEEIRLDTLAYIGVWVPDPSTPGEWMLRLGPGPHLRENLRHVEQSDRRPRRARTPERVEKAAKAHAAAPDGQQVEAVKKELGVEDRQASRYIADARKAGLIPPTFRSPPAR